MHRPYLRLALFAAGALGLAVVAAAVEPKPIDAAARLQRFREDVRGAGAATTRRQLEDLRADLYGRPARFSGTVWSLASVSPSGGDQSAALVSWEFAGMKLAPTGAESLAGRLPDTAEATLAVLRTGDLQLYGLVVDRSLADRLRRGAEVTVSFEATGLRETSLAGVITDVETPSAELVCPEGHRFDAATGYRFCPFCGHPLSPTDPSS